MVNIPPVYSGNNRLNITKKSVNERIRASTATVSREPTPQVNDRRNNGERRKQDGKQQCIDRRMIRDRRRPNIDISV